MLAKLLGVSTKTIDADLAKIRREVGTRITKSWGPEGAAGYLLGLAEECVREAKEAEDWGLAWAIGSQLVSKLKDLGALGKQGEQEGFKVTFETVGQGMARMTEALERAFDPAMSGERVVEGRALPLRRELRVEESVAPANGSETAEGETNPVEGDALETKLPELEGEDLDLGVDE
jgi:hypothetical protein